MPEQGRKRSKIETIVTILTVLSERGLLSGHHLMELASLDSRRMKEYVDNLLVEELGLVESRKIRNMKFYALTPRGRLTAHLLAAGFCAATGNCNHHDWKALRSFMAAVSQGLKELGFLVRDAAGMVSPSLPFPADVVARIGAFDTMFYFSSSLPEFYLKLGMALSARAIMNASAVVALDSRAGATPAFEQLKKFVESNIDRVVLVLFNPLDPKGFVETVEGLLPLIAEERDETFRTPVFAQA
ncbi:MAG: hypothetical protein ABWW70_05330 [Thermoproteota archaeon]